MKSFSRLARPYLIWMLVLVVVPILIMVGLSFLDIQGFDIINAKFTLKNFSSLKESVYAKAFYNSMKLAFIATFICFLIGYPVAYILSNSKIKNKYLVLLILILPMWTNMLLRLYAIEKIMIPNSILNMFGISFNFYGTEGAVILGLVTMYLPFMIFPIYTVLEKIDKSLLEASKDLGANDIKTFLKVTFPLSLKGVMSGIIMVFLPSAMGFAIPQRLGAGKVVLIGNVIENMFMKSFYNIGSLLSLVVILLVMGALAIIAKIDEEGETLL